MNCPRCKATDLSEEVRDGVVVDLCTECRGLWLDRGELEKLVSLAAQELLEFEGQRRRDPEPRSHRGYDPIPERYPRRDRDSYRKKRWYEVLGDVFD